MPKLRWRAFQVYPLIRVRIRVFLVVLASCCCVLLHAEKIPDVQPHGYVTDLADVIEPNTEQRIEALCAEVDQKTGAQIAIVTVRSLEGLTRQEYGVELFKHLGVGNKKDDRGVLLLLAPPERQYWIEVGYGLEPVINDARAGDIGRSMVPLLRENQYSAAVENAVGQLAQLIAADRGVTLDAAPKPVTVPSEELPGLPWWTPLVVFFGIFLLLKILARTGRRRRRWPFWIGPMGGGWGGGGWGGGGFGGSSGGWGGGGGFGGFGGGSSGGGGAGGSW